MTNRDSAHTKPSAATVDEEEREAHAPHGDASQEHDDDAAAPSAAGSDVGEHYRDMAEKGAHAKGEGELP